MNKYKSIYSMFALMIMLGPSVFASLEEPGKAFPEDWRGPSFSGATSTFTVNQNDGNFTRNFAAQIPISFQCDEGALNTRDCIVIRFMSMNNPGGRDAVVNPGGESWVSPRANMSYSVGYCTENIGLRTITITFWLNRTSGPSGTVRNLLTQTFSISANGVINECDDAGEIDAFVVSCSTTSVIADDDLPAAGASCNNTPANPQEILIDSGVDQVQAGSTYVATIRATEPDGPTELTASKTSTQVGLGLKQKLSNFQNNTIITGSINNQTAYLNLRAETGYCQGPNIDSVSNSNNCSISSGNALGWDGDDDRLFNFTFNITKNNFIWHSEIIQASSGSSGSGFINISLKFPWTEAGAYKISVQSSYGMDRSNAEAFTFYIRPLITRLQSLGFVSGGGTESKSIFFKDESVIHIADISNINDKNNITALTWNFGNISVVEYTNTAKVLNTTQPNFGISLRRVHDYDPNVDLPEFSNLKQYSLNISMDFSLPNNMGLGTRQFETGCNLGPSCTIQPNPHNDNSTTDGNYTIERITTANKEILNVEAKLDRIEPKVNKTVMSLVDTIFEKTGVDVFSWIFLFGSFVLIVWFGIKQNKTIPAFLMLTLMIVFNFIYLELSGLHIAIQMLATISLGTTLLLGIHTVTVIFQEFKSKDGLDSDVLPQDRRIR